MESSQPKPTQNHPISPHEQEKSSIEDDSSSTFTCEICVEPVLVSQSAMKFNNNENCIHPFCTDCMGKYIQIKLEDNVAKIKCPALDCGQFLDPLSCRPLISRQLFDKWCDVLCNSTVLSMNGVYCPSRDCSALIVNECGGNVERTICPNCKKAYCFRCRVPWHTGFRCEDSVEIRDRNDVAFGVLAEAKKWKRCPRCRHFVERAQGCAIVNCRCGTNFCYKCGNLVNLCECLISQRCGINFFYKCGKQVQQHWCNCQRTYIPMSCMVFYLLFLIISVIYLLYLFLPRRGYPVTLIRLRKKKNEMRLG